MFRGRASLPRPCITVQAELSRHNFSAFALVASCCCFRARRRRRKKLSSLESGAEMHGHAICHLSSAFSFSFFLFLVCGWGACLPSFAYPRFGSVRVPTSFLCWNCTGVCVSVYARMKSGSRLCLDSAQGEDEIVTAGHAAIKQFRAERQVGGENVAEVGSFLLCWNPGTSLEGRIKRSLRRSQRKLSPLSEFTQITSNCSCTRRLSRRQSRKDEL